MTDIPFQIVPWDPQYAADFDRLNRAWLVEHDLLEDGDLKHLEHPESSIRLPGGEIFVAIEHGIVIGTAAAAVHDATTMELVKLAVDPSARGRGVGRRLIETVVAWARAKGTHTLMLLSSTRLESALALYERMGFVHVPLPPDPGYETADVCMVLDLRA